MRVSPGLSYLLNSAAGRVYPRRVAVAGLVKWAAAVVVDRYVAAEEDRMMTMRWQSVTCVNMSVVCVKSVYDVLDLVFTVFILI